MVGGRQLTISCGQNNRIAVRDTESQNVYYQNMRQAGWFSFSEFGNIGRDYILNIGDIRK